MAVCFVLAGIVRIPRSATISECDIVDIPRPGMGVKLIGLALECAAERMRAIGLQHARVQVCSASKQAMHRYGINLGYQSLRSG